MENSNSREYLEKITAAVIDNLRQTGPAPSVQMQDVPRKPFGGMTDEEEAELDDMDEDENKDVRVSERQFDKHVTNNAEFEPSDDDDLARANGVAGQNGNKREFNDYQDNGAEEATEKRPRTTNGSEAGGDEAAHDPNDDTIEDVGAAEKEVEPKKDGDTEPAKEGADNDGDVGMADTDTAPAEDTTTIKMEDGEPDSAAPEASSTSDKEAEDKPAEEAAAAATTDAPDDASKETEDKPAEAPAEAEEKSKESDGPEAMDVDTEKDEPANQEAKEEKA